MFLIWWEQYHAEIQTCLQFNWVTRAADGIGAKKAQVGSRCAGFNKDSTYSHRLDIIYAIYLKSTDRIQVSKLVAEISLHMHLRSILTLCSSKVSKDDGRLSRLIDATFHVGEMMCFFLFMFAYWAHKQLIPQCGIHGFTFRFLQTLISVS